MHPEGWAAWAVLAFFVLGLVFMLYLGVTQNRLSKQQSRINENQQLISHNQDRLQRQDRELEALNDRACRFVTFSRQTQRMIVKYLHDQIEDAQKFPSTAEGRKFFSEQLHRIHAIQKRTGPPPCSLHSDEGTGAAGH